jgi:two-component system, cell cycle response regulator DivK
MPKMKDSRLMSNPAILYVEDDQRSREIMHLLLVEMMRLSHVTFFEDSADFQARIERLKDHLDLVLLDIHVQPFDGFQMLQILRSYQAFQQTPVVALTASVMNEEVQRLRQAGFTGVIAKPIDLDTFPNTLERILNGERIWRVLG